MGKLLSRNLSYSLVLWLFFIVILATIISVIGTSANGDNNDRWWFKPPQPPAKEKYHIPVELVSSEVVVEQQYPNGIKVIIMKVVFRRRNLS
ncbi:MAG: hypothetical protein DRZ82_01855 [Thermoprotei archaeon]|nr:MAG: hypothetical protein DRZ82_01855 [Thermoprotei archaeon]